MTRPLVGYYVHHQGRGHLHRALALGARLRARGLRVAYLSSLPAPDDRPGAWVQLPRDDDGDPHDVAPGGRLHWAPRHHAGLRERTARISRWIAAERPALLVSDVSQEVALLARLHGTPVVSVVLPGDRGDVPHLAGLGVSDRLVGFWPPAATAMVSGLPADLAARLVPVGALSRYAPRDEAPASGARTPRRLVVLSGQGGDTWSDALVAELSERLGRTIATDPGGWTVETLGAGHWVDDPWSRLVGADVVLTRAGQASIAETAAARVPAVVVAAPRPHDEQAHTAAQLAGGPWPAVVVRDEQADDRADDLADDLAAAVLRAADLDGTGWSAWCDGDAADRFVDVVLEVVGAGGLDTLAVEPPFSVERTFVQPQTRLPAPVVEPGGAPAPTVSRPPQPAPAPTPLDQPHPERPRPKAAS